MRSPLRAAPRAEPKRDARVVGESLPRRGALSADVQRAVAVGGPVDGAEAAVRPGERAAGSRERLAVQRGDAARGVFGFGFFFAFLAFAGGGFLCVLFLGLLELGLFAGVACGFSGLGFFFSWRAAAVWLRIP